MSEPLANDFFPPLRSKRLWTSAEAAQAFRVGVSSIKRWTDEGELEAVRTPGGHRRYTTAGLHRFALLRGLSTDLLPPLTGSDQEPEQHGKSATPAMLLDALLSGNEQAVRHLVTPPGESMARRATYFDRVIGDAMREIGRRWQSGELGVDQEHLASNLVIDAIDCLRPPLSRSGRLALLACPPHEWHDLPLRAARLILEWSGWRTEMMGGSLPWASAFAAVARDRPALLGFSARQADPFHFTDFQRLVDFCREHGTAVVVGGEWARGGTGASRSYLRFRTMRGFERWLRTA